MNYTFKTIRSVSRATRFCRCAAALTLSCMVFGTAKADDALKCDITPERRVLASGSPESAVVKVSLKGGRVETLTRPAVNLAIVLDRSSSMEGEKIVRAREAAIAAVERLDERDRVSVIIFSGEIETLVPAQSAANVKDIVRKIQGIEARGSTAIFGGVSQAASEIRKNLDRGMINRIILLSDGQANIGPASPHELGRLGVAMMKEGISVSTVGVGLDYNEDLMTALAGKSDGNSYFVENSDDLPRIFSKELGDVLSVAARKIKLTVRFSNGATPVELIGRDGRIADGMVTVDFNQIYSGQEKYVLIRTEFTVGENGERRNFAVAEASYEEPVSSARSKTFAKGAVSFSDDRAIVKESADIAVVKEVVYNVNAVEMERAVKLSDEGKPAAAQAVFEGNIVRMNKVAEDYDVSFDSEVAEQKALREESSQGKFAPRSRKSVITRSYEIRTQQQTTEGKK